MAAPGAELSLLRPGCLGQLAVAGDPSFAEHVAIPLERAEERVPFAFELPAEEPFCELTRLGRRGAAGEEVELLEPFPDRAELAVRVVDVVVGRFTPAQRVLAEDDTSAACPSPSCCSAATTISSSACANPYASFQPT
jgi:hypothetical protein